MDRPRTSCFWATQPAMTTGSDARTLAAESRARNRPSLVMVETSMTGTVAASTAVRFRAKKNSFQAKITQIRAVEAMPGATMGIRIVRSVVISEAPSISAASRTSRGTSWKNERIIHTAIGRFMAV